MKGGPGGLCPTGFGLSFLLVHPLLRRVAGAPGSVYLPNRLHRESRLERFIPTVAVHPLSLNIYCSNGKALYKYITDVVGVPLRSH